MSIAKYERGDTVAYDDTLVKLQQALEVGGVQFLFDRMKPRGGGGNSVFRKPGQIFGGEHSVVNEFLEKPLGGDCSVFNALFGC